MPDLKDLTEKKLGEINESLTDGFKISKQQDGRFLLQNEDMFVHVQTLNHVFIYFADYHFERGKEFVRNKFRSALSDN